MLDALTSNVIPGPNAGLTVIEACLAELASVGEIAAAMRMAEIDPVATLIKGIERRLDAGIEILRRSLPREVKP
jgi:hypothetical protein